MTQNFKISLGGGNRGYFVTDSTIDFCEDNYTYSYYIAELFNTLSSFIYVVYAFIIIKHTRMVTSGVLLGLIGIGSALFHATLIYKLQLLDELPMLWFASWNLRVIMKNSSHYKHYLWMPVVLALSTSLIHVYFEIPVLFFIVHTVLQIPLVYFAISYVNISIYRPYTIKYIVYILFAFLFWTLDMVYCDLVQMYHFHSLWHILSGLSMVSWIQLVDKVIKTRVTKVS